MAIRLLVNVPPHVAGSVVQAGALDEAFVQELLDSGQAVEDRSDAGPADPADVALCEVFELEDQIDAAISRRARVVMLVDGLDEGARAKVSAALITASRVRPELFGLDELPTSAVVVATDLGLDDVKQLRDRAQLGIDLLLAIPPGFDLNTRDPVEIVSELQKQIMDLESAREIDRRRIEAVTGQLDAASADLATAEAKLAALSVTAPASVEDQPTNEPEVKGKKPPKA
ncbi:MAG: hypothetical protein JHC96_05540 [Brevundimonas sp.]|uniref:hypothetical protein n=1 Tax=Brevundimonas sp. TaxID=1871086 RepID=UPI001A34C97B|nr:hypothetical protein [Brevundimonas sp.]MBJ7318241.1 hypothetical protein [Brevundimonas sp.]